MVDNSLLKVLKTLVALTYLYGDNRAVVCTATATKGRSSKLITALIAAKTWFNNHKLSLNIKKTTYMNVGTKQCLSTWDFPDVNIDNNVATKVDTFKYLGFMLYCNLKSDTHISYVRQNAYRILKILGRTQQYVCSNSDIQLYKTLILPNFGYGDVIYDAKSITNSRQLRVLPNDWLRVCLNRDPRTQVINYIQM